MNPEEWTPPGVREAAPVCGGRLIYRPGDLIDWVEGKTVALIGDGPSKRKYIFAPERVITIAINKAGIFYPASFVAVVADHFDDIMVQLPPWMPMVFFGETDIRKHNIGPGLWSVIVLLSFLGQHAGKIYIQGLDLSSPKYLQQIPLFKAMVHDGRFPDPGMVRLLNGGPLSEVFKTCEPDQNDIC
jgi:hypothetical protein